MLGYTLISRMPKTALLLLGLVAACSQLTLTLVDPAIYHEAHDAATSVAGSNGKDNEIGRAASEASHDSA